MKISDFDLINILKLTLPSLLYCILYHPVVNIFVYVPVHAASQLCSRDCAQHGVLPRH
jgi:hypothetical protein